MKVDMATPDRVKKAKAMIKQSPLYTPESIRQFIQDRRAKGEKDIEFLWILEPMSLWFQKSAKKITQLDDYVIPAGPPASPEIVEKNRLALEALMEKMVSNL